MTYLSPYLSRGVISPRFVLNRVLAKGYDPATIEKFIQELTWREYWQQVWIAKGSCIDHDLKHPQHGVQHHELPTAIFEARTGIQAVDEAIAGLYRTGYMHNHLRMYVASIACNIAGSHWRTPAKWLYYHLWDGDWASNALSWQWVAGTNSNKQYRANQENINKYCYTHQTGTFLDVSYERLPQLTCPEVLKEHTDPTLHTPLPEPKPLTLDPNLPTYIYNAYNLDPLWGTDAPANRVLLLEPEHFEAYPISERSVAFLLNLTHNIENLQVFVGSFDTLKTNHALTDIRYKEHPWSRHYTGTETPRAWLFDVHGYYPSFFAYWKRCKKQFNTLATVV
ncbi:FAD-binding domain-containing protein [uncultured Altibacter sp.]|uniref:FAD-binding domain-containing protein n=1 Tax=uncultured Altibacter sp. TaxID=2506933 RepID=UPI0030DAF65C